MHEIRNAPNTQFARVERLEMIKQERQDEQFSHRSERQQAALHGPSAHSIPMTARAKKMIGASEEGRAASARIFAGSMVGIKTMNQIEKKTTTAVVDHGSEAATSIG